ncbi:hypothetical protein [Fodinicola feengrottensis]|uniref:hypothetical protein n=1 Tax=Fodinicola feengrottensis TaxID=435914 RepID=UPI0013D68513|nr:hypothetical protein [Fodinicola feengrottensis]
MQVETGAPVRALVRDVVSWSVTVRVPARQMTAAALGMGGLLAVGWWVAGTCRRACWPHWARCPSRAGPAGGRLAGGAAAGLDRSDGGRRVPRRLAAGRARGG